MKELPKAYDAKAVESKWYVFWFKNNMFSANPASNKPPYCIVIPPPNVTGVLHMGHALVNTLQDVLIRWKRMLGFETLWIPGTDHAGISTQTVVERHLMKTLGKKRKDFPREDFLERTWQWKEENENLILNQLKRLGCSCDWNRLRFTMDEGNNLAVRAMFKKLFDEGLIYRGDYLVNWDPITQTAIADDEVEYEERQSFLWHFKYPFADGSGYVKIATTRPETMLGDTAVAVSPKDARYSKMIGKTLILPLMNREIPLISDRMVDPSFGTGAVKVTPAHDPNDYQMGLSHKLPFINIMTPDGKINENGGKYANLTMEEARHAIVADMHALGLVEKIEPHIHRVGISYRSKATIEPYISKQWFVKMEKFGPKLRAAISDGVVSIIPKNWESTYYHWIDNLRDWCISRQLWWGHRIPIWYNKKDSNVMICYEGPGIPPEAQEHPADWIQDEDVLDTWFSSALWPFATLGWPLQTEELDRFYPNSVLVTGHDILFFWVARMIMMGEYAMHEAPFPEVFLHGLIYGKSYWRDVKGGGIVYVSQEERQSYELGKPQPKEVKSKWEKMSKSKGNIIDPIEIIDQYGTDAMRMALCSGASQAREIDLDLRRFEEFKNFANKVWNGARFVFMNLEGLTDAELSEGIDESCLNLEDRWILSVLNKTVKFVQEKLSSYMFDQAAAKAYDFFWKEFCSYYVEIAKPTLMGKTGTISERKNKQILLTVILCQAIRLIHPMAPFITEEIFQLLKDRFPNVELKEAADLYTQETVTALFSKGCIQAPYPKVIREEDMNPTIDQTFELVERVVYAIRNIRGEMKIPPSSSTDVHIIGNEGSLALSSLKENTTIVSALIRVEKIEIHYKEPALGFTSSGIVDDFKILIPLPEAMIKQEIQRLEKEKERLVVNIEKISSQLENQEFIRNAPTQLVEKQKLLLEQNNKEYQEITDKLSRFSF